MTTPLPGFAAPSDAQSCFRAVLEAMSRPGNILRLDARLTPPERICLAAAAALLTLADASTGVSLPQNTGAAQEWLVFHTGARLTAAPKADFILAWDRPRLAELRQGTDDEPETSATLILQLPSLDSGRRLRLAGPGIESTAMLNLPLDDNFFAEWQWQRRRNPLGVDLLLCAGDQLVALPRSVDMEIV